MCPPRVRGITGPRGRPPARAGRQNLAAQGGIYQAGHAAAGRAPVVMAGVGGRWRPQAQRGRKRAGRQQQPPGPAGHGRGRGGSASPQGPTPLPSGREIRDPGLCPLARNAEQSRAAPAGAKRWEQPRARPRPSSTAGMLARPPAGPGAMTGVASAPGTSARGGPTRRPPLHSPTEGRVEQVSRPPGKGRGRAGPGAPRPPPPPGCS